VGPDRLLAHHAGAIDPKLADWIKHQIDSVSGLGPGTIVIVLGAMIVVFPLVLGVLAVRARRQQQQQGEDSN
jgi:hypothetical protein